MRHRNYHKGILLSTDFFLTDNEYSGSGKVSFSTLTSSIASNTVFSNTYASKALAVTNVAYDSANAKFTQTVNGAAQDIISINTLQQLVNTDTHYTSKIIVGASSSATENAIASNGSVYINVIENNTIRSSNNIKGFGGITVTSDSNGDITIVGTSSGGSVASIATGVGLTGGPITTSGTIKTNLSSELSLGTIGVTSNLYAIGVDDNGYLAVSIPGSNTDTLVTQTATTTNADYEILFSATADNTTRTEEARKAGNLTFNPSTGTLSATTFNGTSGSLTGNLTIGGSASVGASTNYSNAIIRNIILSNTVPLSSVGGNGDVCIVYS